MKGIAKQLVVGRERFPTEPGAGFWRMQVLRRTAVLGRWSKILGHAVMAMLLAITLAPAAALAHPQGGGFHGGFHGHALHGDGFHGGEFHGGFHGGGFHGGFHGFHRFYAGRFGHGFRGAIYPGVGVGLAFGVGAPWGWGYFPPDYGYSAPVAPQYWYYCYNPPGYYPWVSQCYGPWVTVPAG